VNRINYPEIKRFVRETLGCSCPEQVFDKIEYLNAGSGIWERKINVGDRLLVYILTMNEKSDIRDVINTALKQGIEERDTTGLNRFRLVLVSSCPEELCGSAEQAFKSSKYTDEKAYLHIISERDLGMF
jgi:hypothetical protein